MLRILSRTACVAVFAGAAVMPAAVSAQCAPMTWTAQGHAYNAQVTNIPVGDFQSSPLNATFNYNIDPSSIITTNGTGHVSTRGNANVVLYNYNTGQLVPIQVRVTGTKLELAPRNPLSPFSQYSYAFFQGVRGTPQSCGTPAVPHTHSTLFRTVAATAGSRSVANTIASQNTPVGATSASHDPVIFAPGYKYDLTRDASPYDGNYGYTGNDTGASNTMTVSFGGLTHTQPSGMDYWYEGWSTLGVEVKGVRQVGSQWVAEKIRFKKTRFNLSMMPIDTVTIAEYTNQAVPAISACTLKWHYVDSWSGEFSSPYTDCGTLNWTPI